MGAFPARVCDLYMPEPMKEILALDLPCDPRTARVVRDALAGLDWLGWVLGDVTLVASELVANAVTHSGAEPSDTLTVRADLAPDHLRIAVRDPGRSGDVPHIRDSEALTEGGWGLLIVEQLSLRWGVERDNGNLVWADVALPVTDEQDARSSARTHTDGSPPS
jgi:anti-sigma regulatory factor (Ser/Thr protein kinase)